LSTTKLSQRAGTTADQNDPSELLEVLDATGRPTGRARQRAAIHVDGDWHRAFHCWIVRDGRVGREVVLQRRALTKDTFPGRWDAAAAGHWRYGETPEQAAREVAEELGLDVPFASLSYRTRERTERRHPNGLVDREYHDVYVLEWPAPLSSYRPDPREVSMLAAFPADDLIEVAANQRAGVEASEAVMVDANGRLRPVAATLTRTELVPYSAQRLRRVLELPAPTRRYTNRHG
jgi:isopentenyldiphosphate isomerase